MKLSGPKVEAQVPVLRALAERLRRLIDELYHPVVRFDPNDSYARMALGFVSKQNEHLKSVCILVDNGQARDAELIARTMLEGMVYLLWTAGVPTDRATKWAAYAWVQDLEVLKRQRVENEAVDPAVEEAIRGQLGHYGHLFRVKAGPTADPLDDKYRHRWTTKNVREVFKDLRLDNGRSLEPYYVRFYDEVSNWVHWNPRGIAFAIHNKGVDLEYHRDIASDAVRALWIATHSAVASALLLDDHLKLGFRDQLDELRAALGAWAAEMLTKTGSGEKPT